MLGTEQRVPGVAVTSNRTSWPVGLRVARKDTQELGTVVEHNNEIKVKWDDGKTSYYRHGQEANVELRAAEGVRPPWLAASSLAPAEIQARTSSPPLERVLVPFDRDCSLLILRVVLFIIRIGTVCQMTRLPWAATERIMDPKRNNATTRKAVTELLTGYFDNLRSRLAAGTGEFWGKVEQCPPQKSASESDLKAPSDRHAGAHTSIQDRR